MGLNVPPARVPITIYQGATFRLSLGWKTGPTKDLAEPVDLSGCAARSQVRELHYSSPVLASMTTENGGIALGGPSGAIDLFLPDEITAALPWSRRPAHWDLEIVWPDGDVTRLVEGPAKICPEVTR